VICKPPDVDALPGERCDEGGADSESDGQGRLPNPMHR
jgi:hypothetical protein